MSTTPKTLELKEQRTSIIHEARRMLEANPNLDAEHQATYDKMMADVDRLADEIKAEERQEHLGKLEAELKESASRTRSTPANKRPYEWNERKSFNAWIRRQAGIPVDASFLDGDSVYNPFAKELNIKLGEEQRTGLTVGSNSAGGYLAPQLFPTELERWLKYYCPLRQFVRVERTENGDKLPWPIIDFTGDTVSITAEVGSIPEADPTTSEVVFGAYKTANKILLSTELMTDSFVDLVPLISSGLGEIIGRSQESYFETGTGSSQPTGLVTAATNLGSEVGTAITSGLSFDNIINLKYAVDRVYQPECAFFLTNQTLNTLRLLKDSNNRYLMANFWEPVKNQPEEIIDGHRIIVTSSMDDYSGSGAGTGSGGSNPFVIFAPPSKFMIRDVRTMVVSVNPYLYQATGQVAIFGELRSDSNYIGPGRSIAYLSN